MRYAAAPCKASLLEQSRATLTVFLSRRPHGGRELVNMHRTYRHSMFKLSVYSRLPQNTGKTITSDMTTYPLRHFCAPRAPSINITEVIDFGTYRHTYTP